VSPQGTHQVIQKISEILKYGFRHTKNSKNQNSNKICTMEGEMGVFMHKI